MIRFAPLILIAALCGAMLAAPVAPLAAQEFTHLGTGRLLSNDAIGDGDDRWHSGSYTYSRLYGRGWAGRAPETFGDLLELRFRADVMTPDAPGSPVAGDRPYVGAVSVGVHSHVERAGVQMRVGVDAVFVGPQTGLGSLQTAFHDALGIAAPDLSREMGNATYGQLSFEAAQEFTLGGGTIRPFFEARGGVETLARVGVDYIFGDVARGGLMLRDTVTGQLYRGIAPDAPAQGPSFVIGADVAGVGGSHYLPESDGYVIRDTRTRVRAGIHTQVGPAQVFYGAAWLSPEFAAQPEGQVVGSLNVRLEF